MSIYDKVLGVIANCDHQKLKLPHFAEDFCENIGWRYINNPFRFLDCRVASAASQSRSQVMLCYLLLNSVNLMFLSEVMLDLLLCCGSKTLTEWNSSI